MRHAQTARGLILASLLLMSLIANVHGAEPHQGELRLNRIVLFSSGVGFFEHRGQVEGNRRVELKFNADQINDLLKSMVLLDMDGGTVSSVAYDSKDPASRTLKTFAIDLTGEPTLAALLRQVRGEKVQLDTGSQITGTLVGIERRRVHVGKDDATEADFVNLLTATGLKSVALDNVSEIRLLNEKLNSDLQQALAILAAAHATDKKTITLNFQGEGKRNVRVGYINESPVWKTSYRMVLEEGKPPLLQGWAIVENTTEQDWHEVALTLVSGRPVSFVMDLYQPLYLDRPVVVPELFAGFSPRTYDQDLAGKEAEFRAAAGGQQQLGLRGFSGLGGGMGGMGGGFGGSFGGSAKAAAEKGTTVQLPEHSFRATAQTAAAGQEVGELFRYVISKPVSIERQRSAMLAIINESVRGEKVSIYNPQTDQKHPLNGLKFTNTSDLHLMQGPITVFDGGEYAGDAQIEDIAPKASRLMSYALDLDTEIASQVETRPRSMVNVRIAKGTVFTRYELTRKQIYDVKNSGQKAKSVIIEQMRQSEWQLVEPKEPSEQTRNWHRFAVNAPPGEPARLVVSEKQLVTEQVALSSFPDESIVLYQASGEVSQAVKDALDELQKRKSALAQVATEEAKTRQLLGVIAEEQDRIRQNMQVLDRNSDLYQRYVKEFTQQEDEVKKLRREVVALTARQTSLRQDLDEYLSSLDVQ